MSRLTAVTMVAGIPVERLAIPAGQPARLQLWPGSYQGNTLWRLGSAADGHHARRRYTIPETPTTDRTEGTDQEDHRTILFQVSESGSMILTAYSFLPAWPRCGSAGPRRPEDSVRARILVLPIARGNSP